MPLYLRCGRQFSDEPMYGEVFQINYILVPKLKKIWLARILLQF